MNSQWQTFLETRTARIDDLGNPRFPGAPADADCALCDISQLGLIAVTGDDAESFLQGQLTNDLRGISDTHTQLSSHCSPKGRMLASFRVLKLGDAICLQLPRNQLGSLMKRLRMFLLRARASLRDVSDDFVTIGLSGECAAKLLASQFVSLPERDNDATRDGQLVAIRMPGPKPRFQIIGPEAAMESVWDALSAHASILDADHWALLDIRAGIPTVYPETADAFVPQMANLQLIDGVSFTKGCYTGQEVVARMQYLGKLKRRMYLAQVVADARPNPGDELQSPASRSQKAAGRVVDARPKGNGRYELLAVLEIAAAESGEVHLGADGPRLTLAELPYDFPAEG